MKTPNTSVANELREELKTKFRHTGGLVTKEQAKEGLKLHTNAGEEQFLDFAMKLIEAHTAAAVKEARDDELEFAKEVIYQWGYGPYEGIYTSGGLSTLETAFGILHRHNLLNKHRQFIPSQLTKDKGEE